MTHLVGESKKIYFIIDMHIPPNIGTLGANGKENDDSHVLNNKYSVLFTKNILDKHYSNMISVVAHHRHCKPPTRYYSKEYNLNFFLTPAGGNCDIVCKGKCNQTCSDKYKYPYHAIKVNYRYVNSILTVDTTNPYEIIHL